MTITPGYWKSRIGAKIRVLCTDGPDKTFPVIAYNATDSHLLDEESMVMQLAPNGRTNYTGADNDMDLISPWVDEPKMVKKCLWACSKTGDVYFGFEDAHDMADKGWTKVPGTTTEVPE